MSYTPNLPKQALSTPIFVNISSTQRENFPTSSSSNFRIKLQAPVLFARKISLIQANIPYSWFVFNSSTTAPFNARINNHIRFVDSTALPVDCQITPGTYNINDLMTEMKTQMEAVSPDTFTFTYDLNTLILTISSSSPNFQLLFAPIAGVSDTLWYEIGFDNVDTVLGATQIGVRTVNLTGPFNIYVKLAQIRQPIFDANGFNATFSIQNKTSNFGDIIRYSELENYNSVFDIELRNLVYVNVILTSEFGELQMNNADWNMVLKFE